MMRSLSSRELFIAGQLTWLMGTTLMILSVSGCAGDQAELNVKGQIDGEIAQMRAHHNEDLTSLRERELPQLRGGVEQAIYRSRELENKQEDLKHRLWELEQEIKKIRQVNVQPEVSNIKDAVSPLSKSIQERLEVQEELINSLLNQLTEQSKRLRVIEKLEKIEKIEKVEKR